MLFSERVKSDTQDKLLPGVVDNVLNSNILVMRTMSAPKMWSGETLRKAIKVTKSSTGGSFNGVDTFATSLTETRIRLSYEPKGYYQSIVIGGIEEAVNETDSQVISLMRVTLEEGKDDMADSLGDIAYGIGSGKDFEGSGNLNDDGTTVDLVGAQSRATYPQLKGTKITMGGALALSSLANLMKGVAAAGSVSQRPTLAISNQTVWNLYEGLLTANVQAHYNAEGYPQVTASTANGRAVPQTTLGGAQGFASISYRGLPFVADDKSPASKLQFINENYFDFYNLKSQKLSDIAGAAELVDGVYKDANLPSVFQWTGFKDPTAQFAEVGQIITLGNFVTWQPRRHGYLANVTS